MKVQPPTCCFFPVDCFPAAADGTRGDLSAGARVDCAHCSATGWSTMALLSTFNVGLPVARALDVALLLDVICSVSYKA